MTIRKTTCYNDAIGGDEMTTEQDELLTTAMVAAELLVNVQTVRAWIRDGVLPARRVGLHQYRIRRSDLRKFVDAGAQAVKVASP